MEKEFIFYAEPSAEGKRLDQWLTEQLPDLTRSALQKLCADGHVRKVGKAVTKNLRLRGDECITVQVPEPKEDKVVAQDIPLDVVYEDDDLLVVNKPKGMVVHPAPGNYDGTLVNALLYHCHGGLSGINGVIRPGIVHRIDKDTSGLLMVAKNDFSHVRLAEQLSDHSFTRVYNAIVYGGFTQDDGTIDASIGRNPNNRLKMCVTSKNAKNAVTHYHVLERLGDFTMLELKLETGRTHQIRVHMAHLGHPVAGDAVYGPKKVIAHLMGQCLHARTLGFVHPRTNQYLEFTSPLPPYFFHFLESLRKKQNRTQP